MLLNIVNAGKEIGVHPNTVRKLIWSGKLPAVRIGRRVLIRRNTLERFIKQAEAVTRKRNSRKATRPLVHPDGGKESA